MSLPVLISVEGPVATVTINRPERLNAMDSAAHLAFSEALDAAADDAAVRIVVVTGAGDRAFSAGRDLRELSADLDEAARGEVEARWARTTRLTDRFDYPKPLIARVPGLALGGGFEIVLACDIVVACDESEFALPEARRGLIPSAGGVHRLPRQLPLKTAMGMLLTGNPISAARALELGLVNEVVGREHLDEAVGRWVSAILACAPLSIRSIREQVAQSLHRPLHEAMAATYPSEERRRASADAREGPLAFAQKRHPVWSGS